MREKVAIEYCVHGMAGGTRRRHWGVADTRGRVGAWQVGYRLELFKRMTPERARAKGSLRDRAWYGRIPEAVQKAPGTLARERVVAGLRTLSREAEDLLKATADDARGKVEEARVRAGAALERAEANYAWQRRDPRP
jgi:hypothetical protein